MQYRLTGGRRGPALRQRVLRGTTHIGVEIRQDLRRLTHTGVQDICDFVADLYAVLLYAAVYQVIVVVILMSVGICQRSSTLARAAPRILHGVGKDIPETTSHTVNQRGTLHTGLASVIGVVAVIILRLFGLRSAEQHRYLRHEVTAAVDGQCHLHKRRALHLNGVVVCQRVEECVVLKGIVGNALADTLDIVIAGLQRIAHDRFIRQLFILRSAVSGNVTVIDRRCLHTVRRIHQQIGRGRLCSHHLCRVHNIVEGVHITQRQGIALIRHLADCQRVVAVLIQRRVAEIRFCDRQSAAEDLLQILLFIVVFLCDTQLARAGAAEQLHDHLSILQLFHCIRLARRIFLRLSVLHRQRQCSRDRCAGSFRRLAPGGVQRHRFVRRETHRTDGTVHHIVPIAHVQVAGYRDGVVGVFIQVLQIHLDIHLVCVGGLIQRKGIEIGFLHRLAVLQLHLD